LHEVDHVIGNDRTGQLYELDLVPKVICLLM
jgi:hypothetical protein